MSNSTPNTALVTGATDGLGKATAERLANKGWRVLLHGRDAAKGEAVTESLRRSSGNQQLHYFNADLGSLAQTRALAEALRAAEPRLDVLVNNAGIGPRAPGAARQLSADGHELFFAVNYLSGYLLTHELLPLLQSSQAARIINVASIGQQALDFDDLMLNQDYDDMRAYRQSKLAQILFTFDLAGQLQGSGVTVNALHPATLMNTAMVLNSRYFPGPMAALEQGVDALEHLLSAPELAKVSGMYYDGMRPERANEQAYDPEARLRLRQASAVLTRAQ
ncbi:MAG: SDR family NAD(P)-dependent oxidoreductase [Pseudomonadales bacterium]|jgi:NAD(P)-dependent dehydrogenase (short-subunit alcohol dehydrogenase family)|nr:SDR family NAD(P)-dependent oxidoreductase [Pseudomonadales bacterium]